MPTETICLNRALAAENLSFSTYTLIDAVHENNGPLTVTALSLATGYSYWAVRNQIRRTQWFESIGGTRRTAVILSEEGELKLTRVRKRLAADHP